MKIYRVHISDCSAESKGFEYFRNKALATKCVNNEKKNDNIAEIEIIDFKPTKEGILYILNVYGDHPNNG